MADLSDPQAVVSGGQSTPPIGQAPSGLSSHRLPLAGVILLVVLTIVWGANWPVNKIALLEIPIFTFRAIVALAAAGAVLLLARVAGHSLYVPPDQRRWLVWVALLNITGWMYFSALALTLIPSGHTAVIANTMPLWAFLIAIPVLKERPHTIHWFGLVLGISGVLLLAGNDFHWHGDAHAGTAAVLAGAICFAGGTVMQKRAPWRMPMLTVIGWQFLIGGIPLTIAALSDIDQLKPVSFAAVIAALYTVLVGMAFGYWAWLKIVGMVPAGVASLTTLAIPAVSLAAGAFLLDESVGWVEIAALALVVGALMTVLPRPSILFNRQPRQRS